MDGIDSKVYLFIDSRQLEATVGSHDLFISFHVLERIDAMLQFIHAIGSLKYAQLQRAPRELLEAGAAMMMMMMMTAVAAAVATAVTMAVTMMVVAAVAEAASVAAPMVRAKANPQPHPNPQQYFRFIPFWNIPSIHSVNGSDNGGDEGSDNDGGGGNGDRRNGSCGR